jgi:hypothetical protein
MLLSRLHQFILHCILKVYFFVLLTYITVVMKLNILFSLFVLLCCCLFVHGEDEIKKSNSQQPTGAPSHLDYSVKTSAPSPAVIFGDDNLITIHPPDGNRTKIITYIDEDEEVANPQDALTLAFYMIGSVIAVLGLCLMISYGKRFVNNTFKFDRFITSCILLQFVLIHSSRLSLPVHYQILVFYACSQVCPSTHGTYTPVYTDSMDDTTHGSSEMVSTRV